MEWTSQPLYGETEWQQFFTLWPVALETIFNNDRHLERYSVKIAWLKKVECRKVCLSNHRFVWIYRNIGSEWDYNRPTPIPPSGGTGVKPSKSAWAKPSFLDSEITENYDHLTKEISRKVSCVKWKPSNK